MNTQIQNHLNAFLKEQFDALAILYKQNLLTPFLMVFFSTIEILGHITSLQFDGFIKKYMDDLPSNMNASDLWGARNSVLHTNSPESKHSREKKARQIIYAWGKADIGLAKKVIEKSGEVDKYTYVRVEDLFASLRLAVAKMQEDLIQKPAFQKACSPRIDKFYARINLNK